MNKSKVKRNIFWAKFMMKVGIPFLVCILLVLMFSIGFYDK